MALIARRTILLVALLGLYAAHPIAGLVGLAAGTAYTVFRRSHERAVESLL